MDQRIHPSAERTADGAADPPDRQGQRGRRREHPTQLNVLSILKRNALTPAAPAPGWSG